MPRRILVIKPDHLGDVLLATPALTHLRESFPQAHIVALVGPWAAVVLANNPHINALQTLPFPGFDRSKHAARPKPFALLLPYLLLLRYAALLRAGRFDTALLLRDDHWWGAALAMLAGIPCRVGHAVPECRPLLSHALPWNPKQHVTEQALQVVACRLQIDRTATQRRRDAETQRIGWKTPLGSPKTNRQSSIVNRQSSIPNLHFPPGAAATAWADAWLSQQLAPGERLVVLHPGTGGPSKLWLAERWAAVANELAALPHVRLLLTGGPGEEALVAGIAAHITPAPLALVGSMAVPQLAALLGRAALVLGVDSGPLHLAVSQGVPTLHLFGPSDAGRFGPWGDPARHVVLRAGLWCSPCGVFHTCPRGTHPPECMERIAVAQVVETARRLLNNDER